jgi:hypothetical protein
VLKLEKIRYDLKTTGVPENALDDDCFSDDAEILSIKTDPNGDQRFYVHYIDCTSAWSLTVSYLSSSVNRRLDQWVPKECLKLDSVQLPQKCSKASKAASETASSSRASTPDKDSSLQGPPSKKGTRKRKVPAQLSTNDITPADMSDMSNPPTPAAPSTPATTAATAASVAAMLGER